MGRSLSFEVDFGRSPTVEELELLVRLGDGAQSVKTLGYDPKKFKWTCESFDLNPYAIHPNFAAIPDSARKTKLAQWTAIYRKYWRQGPQDHAHTTLVADGLATWQHRHGPRSSLFSGYCKVEGNELNALWVFYSLVALSRGCPDAIVRCRDEGRFLRCPVRLKAGLAQIDFRELEELVARDSVRIVAAMNAARDKPVGFEIHPNLRESLMSSAYPLDKCWTWLARTLRELAPTAQHVQEAWAKSHANNPMFRDQFNSHNLSNVWLTPAVFHRPVRADDFRASKAIDFSGVLDGFYGEHWGLEESSEAAADMARLVQTLEAAFPVSQLRRRVPVPR